MIQANTSGFFSDTATQEAPQDGELSAESKASESDETDLDSMTNNNSEEDSSEPRTPKMAEYFSEHRYDISLFRIMDKKLSLSRELDDLELLKKHLPDIYKYLDEKILCMILPSYTFLSYRLPLADYTSYVFGISRASEQILVSLLNACELRDREGEILNFQDVEFGQVFSWNRRSHRYEIIRRYREFIPEEYRDYLSGFYFKDRLSIQVQHN